MHLGRANRRIVMAVDCTVLGWMPVDSLGCAVLLTMSVDGLVIHVVFFPVEVLVLVQMEILMRGVVVGCNWVDQMSRGVEGVNMVRVGTLILQRLPGLLRS